MDLPKLEEEISPPPPFFPSITNIAVAQICITIGYNGAEPSALRSLTDVAARYLQSLARSAAFFANSRGRTDSNILDLVRAIEGLASPRGFAGAADAARPLLRSAVLKELIAFVRSVDEIPFPRPIRREDSMAGWARVSFSSSPSFAQLGRDPPFPHVPRWLPCFPDTWESEGRVDDGEKKRVSARFAQFGRDPPPPHVPACFPESWVGRGKVEADEGGERELPAVREIVRFRLGLGFSKEGGGGIRRKKKRGLFLENGGEEESGGKRRESEI